LTYVGHTLLSGATSSAVLAEEALRLSGLPPNTPIDLYEQVSDPQANQPNLTYCVGRGGGDRLSCQPYTHAHESASWAAS